MSLHQRMTRNERVKRRLMVRFGVEKADRTGFTMNLSESGAFIRTNTVLKPGTTLQVELIFPERAVPLWAKVVWAKKVPPQLAHLLECGMGVRFINPGENWTGFFMRWMQTIRPDRT